MGIAVENLQTTSGRYIMFLKLKFLSCEIKNWLWKNSEVSILGDWVSDEEIEEWSTFKKPYEYITNVLWQGRDECM